MLLGVNVEDGDGVKVGVEVLVGGRWVAVDVGATRRVAIIPSRTTFVNPVKYTRTARQSKPSRIGRKKPPAFAGLKRRAANVMPPTNIARAR